MCILESLSQYRGKNDEERERLKDDDQLRHNNNKKSADRSMIAISARIVRSPSYPLIWVRCPLVAWYGYLLVGTPRMLVSTIGKERNSSSKYKWAHVYRGVVEEGLVLPGATAAASLA